MFRNFLISLLILGIAFPCPAFALKVNGELEKARLENVAGDPTWNAPGGVVFDTTAEKPKWNDGAAWKEFGTGSGTGGTYTNYAVNGDGESGVTGWTASAGTLAATTTAANVYSGTASIEWTPAAASNTLTNAGVTITSGAGPGGINGALACWYKTASAAHVLHIRHAGTSVQSWTLPASPDGFAPVTLYQSFPTSGVADFQLVAGGTDAIRLECFYGDAKEVGAVDVGGVQPTTYTMTITGVTTNPTKATTTVVDLAQYSCVNNILTVQYTYQHSDNTGAADGSGIYLFAIPSGFTVDTSKIAVAGASGSLGNLGPASTMAATAFRWGYAALYNESNITLLVGSDAAALNNISSSFNAMTATALRISFTANIPVTSCGSRLAVTPDDAASYALARFSGAAATTTVTASSWTTFNHASWASPSVHGKASAAGTGCGLAANDIGMCVSSLPADIYEVEYQGTLRTADIADATATSCMYQIYDGTNHIGAMELQPSVPSSDPGTDGTGGLRGIVVYSGHQTNLGLRLRAKRTYGAGSCGALISNTSGGEQPAAFLIKSLTKNQPAPVFTNYQGEFMGAIKFGSDCAWSITQTTFAANYPDDASCTVTVENTSGKLSAISGYRPGFVLTDAEPGTYVATVSGGLYKNNTADATCVWRLTDGTEWYGNAQSYASSARALVSGFSASRKITSKQTLTVDVQGACPTTGACDVYQAPLGGTTINVWKFPYRP